MTSDLAGRLRNLRDRLLALDSASGEAVLFDDAAERIEALETDIATVDIGELRALLAEAVKVLPFILTLASRGAATLTNTTSIEGDLRAASALLERMKEKQ